MLSSEEAGRIAAFLAVDAAPGQADLAFVFGTRHLEPAYIAADLLRRGVVNYVTITGGKNRLTGDNEALAHLAILVREGVPPERIIVESSSTNTLQNVTFALPKIAACLPLDSIRAVVVVTKWYHCRRALMTLKRHLPPGIRYFTRSYEPSDVTRQDWYLHAEAARRVLKEWQCLPAYLQQGHLAEIRREGEAFV
jgi:uncharacterized SAM-binding protein YcdF (DUF218 family)